VWGRGDIRVEFTRFPFHPGEPVEVHLGITPGGPEVVDAHYALCRYDERPAWDGNFLLVQPTHVARPVADERSLPSGHADVRLVFDVPADAGGTCLSGEFPAYWELEVSLWTTSGFVVERFLVPIYERPDAAVSASPTGQFAT
jgi:hypothetical protein